MKKKLLAFILLISMLTASSAGAESLSEGLVSSLAQFNESYDINNEENVTWKTVTDIAADLVNKNGGTSNSVSVLLDKKIITKVPQLDKTPTAEEIAEIFVKVLGYDMYVNNKDYMAYAYDLDLFDGVEVLQGAPMNGADFSRFLLNVLNTNVIEIGADVANDSKYVTETDIPLLYDRFNVVKKKGVVTAVSYTTLTGVSNLSENYIAVDGIRYLKGKVDAERYLGQYVEFYVMEDEDGAEGTVIYMIPGNKNKTVEFSSADILSFDGFKYEYDDEENKKVRTVKIADDASYIYNDFAAGKNSLSEEELVPKSGRIKAVDNDGDNDYDVIFIYDVKPVILRKADAKYEKLYFDYNLTYNGMSIMSLDEDNFDGEYRIYDQEMNPITFEELQSRSVLSIGQAKNGDYIIVSSLYKGIGSITSVESYADGQETVYEKIYVADSEYDVSPYYERGSTDYLKTGLFGTFYFDFNYQLVGFVKESSSQNIGYLVRGYYDEEDPNGAVAVLKIFNMSGVFERLELADKVTLYSQEAMNGVKLNKEDAVNRLDNQSLIAYNIANGKVTKIYKTVTDEEMKYDTADYPVLLNKTVLNSGNKLGDSRLYQGIMGGRYRVPKSTVIFSIPVDKAKEDKYSVYYGSAFPSNGDKYFRDTVKFYNIDSYLKINIMVEEKSNTSASVSASADMYVVDKVSKFLGEDDIEGIKISCYGENQPKTLFTTDLELVCASDVWGKDVKVTELKKGDIIQVSANEEGEMTGFRVLFEGSNPGEYRSLDEDGKAVGLNAMDDFTLYYGRVSGVDDNAIIQNCTGTGLDRMNNVAQLTNNIKNYPTSFYQYDSKSNEVSVITLDDIEVGDEVMIRRTYTSVNIVYKIIK